MIPKDLIDKIHEQANIVSVIGKSVQLKRSGANFKGLSPFTSERTPSLMVSEVKGIWKDFSSGKGGGVVQFVMDYEHKTYPEAIEWLCSFLGIEFVEEMTHEERVEKVHKESLYVINEAATRYYMDCFTAIQGAAQFMFDRGFSINMLKKFQVGFAPNTIASLTNELVTKQGYDWKLCVQSSVIGYKDNTIYDRFRNRIMFPIRSVTGRLLGFGGRDVSWKKGSDRPKYLNSSDSLIYHKSEILYGIFESKKAIIEADFAFLSEGYTDVIGFHESGVENILAASGTSFTPEQAKLIKRLTSNVTVLFDSDSSGIKAALRSVDILLAEGISVKVLLLPAGQDPDDFRLGKTRDEILEFAKKNSKDFIVFKLDYLLQNVGEDFVAKSNAVTEIVSSIAKVVNPIQREVYLKECARITDVDVNALRMMLGQVANDDLVFSEIPEDFMQAQTDNYRTFLIEECERKIVQYLIRHRDQELDFKDVVLEDDYDSIAEVKTVLRMSVRDRVVRDITDDGIEFQNVNYSLLYEKLISGDLSDDNSREAVLGQELNLLYVELRDSAIAENLSSFEQEGVKLYEYVMKDREASLQNSITETLLFLKFVHVEKMVDAEMRQPAPDVEYIFDLLELNQKIKLSLNII